MPSPAKVATPSREAAPRVLALVPAAPRSGLGRIAEEIAGLRRQLHAARRKVAEQARSITSLKLRVTDVEAERNHYRNRCAMLDQQIRRLSGRQA